MSRTVSSLLVATVWSAILIAQASQPPQVRDLAKERDATLAAMDELERELDQQEYQERVLNAADRASALARVQSWSGGTYYAATASTSSTSGFALGFTGHEQTDPSGLIYMQNRFYIPAYGRFTTWDRTMPYKLENPQSFNFNAYAQNNPVMYVDPDGNDITITAHRVGKVGPYHTAVRFTPNNQALYKNNPMFKNVDTNGNRYVTLSAGPSFMMGGKLTAELNKETDQGFQKYQSGPLPMPGGRSEDQVFGTLLGNFNNFANNLDYSLFPSGAVPMFDPNYNSNSFTNGLLQSADFPNYELPITAPGWKEPVPKENFVPPPAPTPELKPLPEPPKPEEKK